MMANGRIRPLWPVLLSILLGLLAFGCSNSNENSGLTLVDQGGNHPSNFLSTHPGYAVSETNQCTECHGSDLTGGISNQSCFLSSCHHDPEPNWVVFPPGPPQGHGTSAKAVPGSSGFVSCQICHADDFSGGGAQVPCLNASCHGVPGQSPHPAEWGGGDTYVHTTTAEQNAPVCAQCHLNGNNSPIAPPSPPAPGGTAPGCFNSTLCHGKNPVPHPLGNTWVTTAPAAQPHGNDAKEAPGASTGFAYCQICHGTGTDFAGGSSGTSCYTCHEVSAPHPSQWRTGDTYLHTSVDEGNASVCAYCHTAGANSPIPPPNLPPPAGTPLGCFNGTLCHGVVGAPHPVADAWITTSPDAQPHGDSAKAAPGATTGFTYCRVCHGTSTGDFNGGFTLLTCRATSCHGGDSPHPAAWLSDGIYMHTTTNQGNAPECGFCHYGGVTHDPTPPPAGSGCFNSTLCH